MQPLTQSTDEVPQGPLTLRVYPGPNCGGSIYQDDGTTLNYKRGEFLRMSFSCEVTSGGLRVHIGTVQGNYHTWWSQYELHVIGWDSNSANVLVNGRQSKSVSTSVDANHVLTLTLPAGREVELEISR
jgi:alpha-glucosidase